MVDSRWIRKPSGVRRVAPGASLTIGWLNESAAVQRTLALEQKSGSLITDVISFHVFEDKGHFLTRSREEYPDLIRPRTI